jgi:nucleotide-binding universal stress UspA family protein
MIEIRHILCPIDFSDGSRRALDQAVALAHWCRARVTALHVFTPAVMPTAAPGAPGYEPPGALHADRDALLDEMRLFIGDAATAGIAVNTAIGEGHPADVIVEQAAAMRTGLIVMGTHGRSGLTRLVLGSVAEQVLRQARSPVLTVPPHHAEVVPATPALYTSILCPVDFSEASTHAVRFAVALAEGSGGHVTVLHVLGHDLHSTPDLYDTMISDSHLSDEAFRQRREAYVRQRLREIVPEAAADACRIGLVGPDGPAGQAIAALAETQGHDLIVLGVAPRAGSDLLLFGSTTHDVLREASCAVLTILGSEPTT